MKEVKVALCLQGTVGNFYTDKKQYQHTEHIDYRIALEHYKKHIFSVNPHVDVFIHCWNPEYQQQIEKDYLPKISIFEKQIDFSSEIAATGIESSLRNCYQKSRWYSQEKVISLKREYERENNFKYDYVIVSRFDLAFLKDLKFSNYDNDIFWAPNDSIDPAESIKTERFLDYWFFSNSETMDLFGTLYTHWNEIQNFKLKRFPTSRPFMESEPNSHVDSWIHAKALKFEIGYTFKEHEEHDLVRAIYKDCQYAGDHYKGIENLQKFETYPKHRF